MKEALPYLEERPWLNRSKKAEQGCSAQVVEKVLFVGEAGRLREKFVPVAC